MSKLVSIVLPVYNGERFLRESIESVLSQTYSNWELLILDDCSGDSTPEIAKAYAEKDSRIRYYRNEKNLQLPGNLNRGFSLARGEYLTWTSDDNRFRPEALERMAETLDHHPDAGFVFASCRIINAEGEEIEYIMVSQDSPKWIVGINTVGACFMYTRQVYEQIGDYDAELKLVEDFDYWQRICAVFRAVGIEDILYDYRWHDGALTSTMKKEVFRGNMEKMLRKNRPAFGRLSVHQYYCYIRGLDQCRQDAESNPYHLRYEAARLMNFLLYRVPGKVRRSLKKIRKGR